MTRIAPQSLHFRPHKEFASRKVGGRSHADVFFDIFCTPEVTKHKPIQAPAVESIARFDILVSDVQIMEHLDAVDKVFLELNFVNLIVH